jgi:hypothetical protein
MSAARKRSPMTTARARLSAILDEIEELVCEFEGVRSTARLEVGGDVPDTITQALGDAREMIGDVFDQSSTSTSASWRLAERPPMTRQQLDAELEARGVRRAS